MADEPTDTQTSTTTETTDTSSSTDTTNATVDTSTADAGASTDDATLVGSATTGDGAGDTTADSQQSPTPTPVPDDNGVPEAYELKLTTTNEAGEEVSVDLDPVLVETATPLLKEAGLTNEQADKLMPLVPKIQEQMVKQQTDQFAQVRADWAKQVKEDPEIGGAKLDETLRMAAKAMDRFGAKSEIVDGKETNGFRKLLNESGIGNHPDYVRFMAAVGAAVSEDSNFVRNTTEPEIKKSREELLYPNDVPNKS